MLADRTSRAIGFSLVLGGLLALGACSSMGGGEGGSGSGGNRILNTIFLNDPNAAPAPTTSAEQRSIACPRVQQRAGGSTYRVEGRDGDPASVRYQASFREFARECANLGMETGFRVGFAGVLVLGPAGAPGTLDVPVLLTLLDDGGNTVISRQVRIAVSVPAGAGNAEFRHVEDLGSLPVPENRFNGYRFEVGFEQPGAARARPRR